jgi:hypothetical protein
MTMSTVSSIKSQRDKSNDINDERSGSHEPLKGGGAHSPFDSLCGLF